MFRISGTKAYRIALLSALCMGGSMAQTCSGYVVKTSCSSCIADYVPIKIWKRAWKEVVYYNTVDGECRTSSTGKEYTGGCGNC